MMLRLLSGGISSGWIVAGVITMIVGAAVGGYAKGRSDADRSAEIARLEAVIREQARQRAAAEAVARRAQAAVAERAAQSAKLQETIDAYEDALASGAAGACPADDEYQRRMRAIRVAPPQPAAPAR